METPGPSAPGWRAPRRIATTPISLHSRHEAAAQSSALVETLYYHPNIKIVSFTASARAFSRSPSRGSDGVDKEEVGTLSWSSQLERTIAVGAFRIYRAPASVAFLSCGSALQPILPKSQSWCLDEANSRFILQIRRPNYWRLELPVDDVESQQLAHDLRGVLDNILQFEKTPCPFKRAFTVLLPEPPQEPVKKKPWKPVRRSLPDMGPSLSTPPSRPIDAATTHTAPAREYIRDDSSVTSSPSYSSREASPAPAPIIEASAGLSVLARETRAVSDSAVTVSTLVKRLNERSENEPPLTPTTGIATDSNPVTPDNKAVAQVSTLVSVQPEIIVADRPNTPKSLVAAHEPKPDSTQGIAVQKEVPSSSSTGPAVTETTLEAIRPSASIEEVTGSDLEIHEGAGSQNAQRKVRLRRSTGFGSIRRVASARHVGLSSTTFASQSPASAPESPAPVLGSPAPILESPAPVPESPAPVLESPAPAPTAGAEDPGEESSAESEDSFHSVESWHSPDLVLPPSPPASQSDSLAKVKEQHMDDATDAQSETSENSVATAPDDSLPITESQDEDIESGEGEDLASIYEGERMRPKHRAPASFGSLRRRALSPLPPAALIYSPPSLANRSLILNNRLETMKKLPMAIINKTCSMFLGPPLHLLALMLKVAGRIAAGQWRGQEYGYDADGEQIPVQWDYSDGDLSDSGDEYDMPTPLNSAKDVD